MIPLRRIHTFLESFLMPKIFSILKKSLPPVTIMVIPHENVKSLKVKIPCLGIFASIILCVLGVSYIFSIAVSALEYRAMKERVNYYSKQFSEWNSTLSALRKVEGDFRRLLTSGSKDRILENVDASFSGAIDFESLKQEIEKTLLAMDEFKDFLRLQKDLYLATPKGFPVPGKITSNYGKREDPFSGEVIFHSGVDISASPGTPIKAAADGMVSYSGWTKNNGYVVVLEHGCGFSTIYAHNKKNVAQRGEKIRRGDIIALVGSTGKSTGPHLHYEVWKDGRSVNPLPFLSRES